ncbi:MAG TPA: AAA family ATPase [Ktedonobacterales bacterium]|nr:AAA family ATPase [Ktedonobacterales bacterium]
MAVPLFERDTFLHTLDNLLSQVQAGSGRIALVSGEAGIGKTSLVECFLERRLTEMRVLFGACEALFTPRALGPLYDIAYQTSAPILPLLESTVNRAALFATVLADLTQAALPTVLVIEDIHWADEATLDLIKFLARRIHHTNTLLVLTYRDDVLSKDHPLRLVLGDLPARAVTRLWLPPLSEAAVATLAQKASRPAQELHAVTGGNPFFLTEVLASDALGSDMPGVPTSVSDAVLAQIARRSPEAQRLLELVAVVPTKVAWQTVEAVGGASSAGLEECLAAGLLHVEGGAIGYRHELARQAVESALAPTRRQMLHAEVLAALLEPGATPVPLAQLVHHAVQAEDRTLALRFAPEAAKQASAQRAHREAAAHYRTALHSAELLDAERHGEQRAELLDALSYECSLTGQIEEATQAASAALEIWRGRDQTEKVGHNLRQLSRFHYYLGRTEQAWRYAAEAVELLETVAPSKGLARAYASLSSLSMASSDTAQTVLWGERAIELAERFHDAVTVCSALRSVGSSTLCSGDYRGQAVLEQSLQMALDQGFEEQVASAYSNLANVKVKRREYTEATHYLQKGMAYCADHDLDSWGHTLRGDWALACLDLGDWSGAEEGTAAILSLPWMSVTNRLPALLVMGMLRARRGDPGAEAVLDEVANLALTTGEMQYISPVAAARAEWRWLQGDRDQCVAEAEVGFPLAVAAKRPWYWGEVAIWLWRGGGLSEVPDRTPEPFALQMAGNWRAAADCWEQTGCPYEQALSLLDGDEPAQRAALALFERLGAAPAAEIVRRQLRAAGVRGLPRGPRVATQENPQGLTTRQLEILLLLAEGLRNTEIAERLSTTPKTAAHHVSAILAKLNARSRGEAVRIAYQMGILPQTSSPHSS